MTGDRASELGTVAGHESFRQRRDRLHMNQDEVAAEAGMNRDTVGAIEAGKGSASKRRDLDEALTRLEAEANLPPLAENARVEEVSKPAESEHLIRFKVEGVYGAKALIVKGPVENLSELEAAVDRIMRRLQDRDE